MRSPSETITYFYFSGEKRCHTLPVGWPGFQSRVLQCYLVASFTSSSANALTDPTLRRVDHELLKGEKPAAPGVPARAAGGPDAYGYLFRDASEPDGPVPDWQEIASGGGTSFALGDDEITAAVPIGFPFSFYGVAYTDMYISSNGFLTFDPTQTSDPSNDCPMDPTSTPYMIAPHWDDMDPGDDGALIWVEHQANCGTIPPDSTATSCTIIEWDEFDDFPGDSVTGGNIGSFQVILYDDGDILFQYKTGFQGEGISTSVGIDGNVAGETLTHTCDDSGSLSGDKAIQFYLGSSGDLFLVKSGPTGALVAETFDYLLQVGNDGPDDQTGVTVTDTLPSQLTYNSNSCGADFTNGVFTWDIGALAVGEVLTCNLNVTLDECTEVNNTGTVFGDIPDDGGNNGSTWTVNTGAVPGDCGGGDLFLLKSGPTGALVAETFDYMFQIGNDGPEVQTGVTVTDTLPSQLTYNSNTCGASFSNGVFTWNVGTLAVGEIATCDFNVTLDECGEVNNTGTTFGDILDGGGNNDDSSWTVNSGMTPEECEPFEEAKAIPTMSPLGMAIFLMLMLIGAGFGYRLVNRR